MALGEVGFQICRKNEPNFVRISALASKMGGINKIKAHYDAN